MILTEMFVWVFWIRKYEINRTVESLADILNFWNIYQVIWTIFNLKVESLRFQNWSTFARNPSHDRFKFNQNMPRFNPQLHPGSHLKLSCSRLLPPTPTRLDRRKYGPLFKGYLFKKIIIIDVMIMALT